MREAEGPASRGTSTAAQHNVSHVDFISKGIQLEEMQYVKSGFDLFSFSLFGLGRNSDNMPMTLPDWDQAPPLA